MRNLFLRIGIVFLLLPILVFADVAPSHWLLPDKGEDCTLEMYFIDGERNTCGTKFYELWNCPMTNGDLCDADSSGGKYLIVGEIHKDDTGSTNCGAPIALNAIRQSTFCPQSKQVDQQATTASD